MEKDSKAAEDESSGRVTRSEDYFSRQASSSSSARLTPYSKRTQPEPTRPRLAAIQSPASPTSPKTPRTPRTPLLGRALSPGFNSPSQGFRVDDDIFVLEFSSRYLRAGLGGESRPRCQLKFGPESQKRAGDYSRWLSPAAEPLATRHETIDTWDSDHVLWRMDLRNLDLGLVADKIERALRTALTEHVIVMDDSKKRKFMLALPAVMPHPLLSVLLTSLFNYFPSPSSIILMSSPVLCTIAAGLRSALVVDVGWSSTVVSAVYEYREVQHKRSCRAVQLVTWEVRSMLNQELQKVTGEVRNMYSEELQKVLQEDETSEDVSFEDAEEVLHRMVWCKKHAGVNGANGDSTSDGNDTIVNVPLRAQGAHRTLAISFSQFHRPVEAALFASGELPLSQDDEELALPFLIYFTLLSLPIDVRSACLSRIIISGGGSNIPGLQSRIISELSSIISTRGWDPVHNYGSVARQPSRRTVVRPDGVTPVSEHSPVEVQGKENANKDIDPNSTTPAYSQPPLPDHFLNAIRSHSTASRLNTERTRAMMSIHATQETKSDSSYPETARKIQCYKTLGAWEGASLVAGLRIRGIAEVDREKFMQHGLSSGARPGDTKRQSVQQAQSQRASFIGGVGNSLPKGDAHPWTLGAWA